MNDEIDGPENYVILPTGDGGATVTDRGGTLVGFITSEPSKQGPRWSMYSVPSLRPGVQPPAPSRSPEAALRAWLSWSTGARH